MARHLFHLQHKTNHYDNNHFNVLPPKNRRHIYTSTVISCVCLTRLREADVRQQSSGIIVFIVDGS
jgi:hypothetical protein